MRVCVDLCRRPHACEFDYCNACFLVTELLSDGTGEGPLGGAWDELSGFRASGAGAEAGAKSGFCTRSGARVGPGAGIGVGSMSDTRACAGTGTDADAGAVVRATAGAGKES